MTDTPRVYVSLCGWKKGQRERGEEEREETPPPKVVKTNDDRDGNINLLLTTILSHPSGTRSKNTRLPTHTHINRYIYIHNISALPSFRLPSYIHPIIISFLFLFLLLFVFFIFIITMSMPVDPWKRNKIYQNPAMAPWNFTYRNYMVFQFSFVMYSTSPCSSNLCFPFIRFQFEFLVFHVLKNKVQYPHNDVYSRQLPRIGVEFVINYFNEFSESFVVRDFFFFS